MLHKDDLTLFEKAEALTHKLAHHINETCSVEPKRRPHPDGADGLCYTDSKLISIKIRNKNRAYDGGEWWLEALPWERIARTVAHEVAHLRYPNHGKDFKQLKAELLFLV